MEIDLGFIDLLKMGVKLIGHKILQYRLTTNETLIVRTTHGKVKGVKRLTIYDQPYYSFEGIPFAEPPLGDLRFKAPQPLKPWDGVRDCTRMRNKPLQRHLITKIKEGSEDCLYLNIYTKKMQTDNPLPVMVWIYGGGFQVGEASRDFYSPDYFMEKDVVLIEITYRLGALGFLSLSDPHLNVPGNAGLKDQLMALQWIKQNCLYFNGDPNNITLFGESAGAASTQYLMLTPRAEGLFHKSIMMSGSVLCPWANQHDRGWAYRLAKLLGYTGSENDENILEFLTNINAKELVGPDDRLLTEEEKCDLMLFSFTPVVEPYIGEDCIIPKSPKEMMRTAWGNNIPILIGGTSFEGLIMHTICKKSPQWLENLNDCMHLVPLELNLPRESEKSKELGRILHNAHFGDKHRTREDRFFTFLDLLSYKIIWHGIHRTLLSRKKYSNAPTYLYRFDYDSPDFNHYRILKCGKEMRGVSHADDLSYIFYTIASWKLDKNSSDYLTIQRMIDILTTFAATSDPNCKSTVPLAWTPLEKYSSEKPFKCLNIGNCSEFIDLPEHTKLMAWDSIYPQGNLF